MDKARLDELVALAQKPLEPPEPWLDAQYAHYRDQLVTRLNYYRFLYLLVKEIKPAVSLELGVETGLASAFMARAAEEHGGLVIGVDIMFHVFPAGQLPVAQPNYRFIVGDSTSYQVLGQINEILNVHGQLGVVFQDSSHHYYPSAMEWDRYSSWLSDDGVWVCDDITPAFYEEGVDPASMEVYFDERPGNKAKYKDVLHYGNTVGVIWNG